MPSAALSSDGGILCPKGHEMQVANLVSRVCDVCTAASTEEITSVGGRHCSICGYDLCPRCARRLPLLVPFFEQHHPMELGSVETALQIFSLDEEDSFMWASLATAYGTEPTALAIQSTPSPQSNALDRSAQSVQASDRSEEQLNMARAAQAELDAYGDTVLEVFTMLSERSGAAPIEHAMTEGTSEGLDHRSVLVALLLRYRPKALRSLALVLLSYVGKDDACWTQSDRSHGILPPALEKYTRCIEIQQQIVHQP